MARRNRKTLSGRDDRNAARGRGASRSVPRLGRRKALWRFVGAMALAPLSGTAFGQDFMMPPMPPGGGAPMYQAGGYPPVVGPTQAGYVGMDGGYVTPAGGAGPMVAPPPGFPSGGLRIGLPNASTFTPRLVTSGGYGDGLGWDDGYQSVGAWLPLGINTDTQVMYLDAQGFSSFQRSGGGNFTLGYRYYMPGFDRFVGVYGAYDIDAGNASASTFNRFAVGAESIGRFLSYRINGYIPVGDQSDMVASGQVGDPFFQGNNILFLDRTQTRYQYGGVDAEVGGPLPLIGKYGLNGFVGGYYLRSDVDDTAGFKGRIESNINDDLQVGGKLTSDSIFGTNVWVTMTLRSPRGSWGNFFRKDWLRQPSVQTQMDRSPQREYRIATDVKTSDSPTLAINPLDGQPYLVLHVDPTNGTGVGTFENPAGTFANNPNFDIIYVQPGTLAMNGPFVLFDNQRLLSTAVTHTFDSQRGTFQLPGFIGGPLPVVQNTSSLPTEPVIVLANNNEVSGFQIDGRGATNPFTGSSAFHSGIIGDNITSFDINRNVFSNVTSGVQILHAGSGVGFLTVNTLNGLGAGSSLGMSVATVGDSNLTLSVRGNTVRGFLGEDANGNSAIDSGEDLNGNLTLDPGVGINILATQTSSIAANVSNNTATGNGTGLRLAATEDGLVNATVTRNDLNNNVDAGAGVFAAGGRVGASFRANDVSNNGGPGLMIEASDGGVATLNIGGATSFAGNIFDANNGAGISIVSVGTDAVTGLGSTVQASMQNNIITNTTDDGDPLTRFTGEGVNVLVTGGGQYLNSVIDMNTITGNVSDGMRFTVQGDNSTLRNVVIGNADGNNNNGNFITGNANGIRVTRLGNSRIDQMQILDNQIFANRLNGIDFFISGGLLDVPDFMVADNNILGNGLDGIHGLTLANGILNLDLMNNVISSNTFDGISIQQNRFTIDQGGVTGTWDGNLIAENGNNGIEIAAPMLDLIVGTTDVGNLITRNGTNAVAVNDPDPNRAGVFLPGPGTVTFTNNTISQNGAGRGDVTFGAGIDIESVGFKDFLFVNNRVINNLGDGVEIAAGSNGAAQSFTLNFVDNFVARNQGRGYDVLNQGNSFMDLTIRGTALGRSAILENGREGIYVVNTASFAQTQQGATPVTADTDPTHGMDASAPFQNGSFMTLNVMQNEIIGNGIDQTSTIGLPTDSVGGTGLVIRVGTGDGGYGPFAFGIGSDGGFASQGFAGVVANVTGNFMSGNLGADIYTESFVSTVDPPTTAGTWNGTDFPGNNFNYEGDPLARLDLTFVNNTLEEASFNNAGAFYDNAEGTFKSRTFGRTAPDPNGPFRDADRRRNAQRLAYRDESLPSSSFPTGQPENDGSFLTPGPDGILGTGDDILVPIYDLNPEPHSPPNPAIGSLDDLFLYQGMGESTFRISQSTLLGTNTILNPDGSTTPVSAATLFFLDNQPYNDDTDANGVFIVPFRVDDMPYGWSVVQ
jgi:hypothetical protein